MQNVTRRLLVLATGIGMAGSMFGAADYAKHTSGGAGFVMTNDARKNEVISYERGPDGRLSLADRYETAGRGSGGRVDPLQSQGSLTLSKDNRLLFAANAGSGTVSVFRVS